jgi:F420H(2)-dependent quinone reductase
MTNTPSSADRYGVAPHWVVRMFTQMNVWFYQMSGGHLMNHYAGDPICLVTMTGAKSGRRRTVPLMYVPHGDKLLLVASLGGAPKNPFWYYNLIAHPDVEVEQGGRHRKFRARLADSAEKAELWPICVQHYAAFEDYQKKTARDIPIFICEPRDGP